MKTDWILNKTKITFNSEFNEHTISRDNKPLYCFKGDCKYILSCDKKGNVLSVIFKITDKFNHTYFAILTENESYLRTTVTSVLPLIVRFNKDGKELLRKIEQM